MASPLTLKAKWPTQKQAGMTATDFAPYVSNLTNMFRKVPRPRAPKTIDPVTGTTISLADAKRQVSDTTRAADLSTQNLDAQTGAAVRVGNLGNKLRSLSDLNSREAQINAQMGNQTKAINANIDAQNAGIINQYHDDQTNAEIAQQRSQSENISNAADKFITQRAVKDQMNLERDKATIYSKMYNPGVYNRFMDSLQNSGMDTSGYSRPYDPNWAKKGTLPPLDSKPDNMNLNTTLPTDTIKSMRKYMQQRNTYAAGGMMKVFATGGPLTGDPEKPALREPVKPSPDNRSFGIPGDPHSSNYYAMDYGTNRVALGIDMINNVIGSGKLPNTFDNDKVMRNTLDPKMYQYLYEFNQRKDMAGLNPEQRIQAFHNVNTTDPDIQLMKQTMKSYGYGPLNFYRSSGLMKAGQKVKQKAYGGRIKPFA